MKYDEANQMYRRTLEGYSKINGPMHKTVLEALNNLGEVAMKQSNLEAAKKIFKEAFNKARTISGGKDDALVLYLASNVALVYKLQQRYQESIRTYMDVIVGREKLLGEKHSSTLQSMCEVADVYKMQGEEHSANEWYRRGNASEERRQRGELWPKKMGKPISEVVRNGNSPGDNSTTGPPKLDASSNGVIQTAVENDQMEWESDTIPFVDRVGQQETQRAPFPPFSELSHGVHNIDRSGYSFPQLAAAPSATEPTHHWYASDIDRWGRPRVNVGGVELPQVDQVPTTFGEGSIPQPRPSTISSIDRAGIMMPQQYPPAWASLPRPTTVPSRSALGSGIDRAGMAAWNGTQLSGQDFQS
jgi:hypothetical protein